MKRYIRSSMEDFEVESAILDDAQFDVDSFNEYFGEFHQPEKGALKASEVRVGDFIKNTECAEEVDLDHVVEILDIIPHSKGWEEFDYTFHVMDHTSRPPFEIDLHYMADEYVGVPVSSVY